MKEHLFDKRVVQRALQEGLLDKEVYQRMLDELPDLSHKVQVAGVLDEAEGQSVAPEPSASVPPAPASVPAPATYGAQDAGDTGFAGNPASANPPPVAPQTAGDTLEMERPQIPGSYSPDY